MSPIAVAVAGASATALGVVLLVLLVLMGGSGPSNGPSSSQLRRAAQAEGAAGQAALAYGGATAVTRPATPTTTIPATPATTIPANAPTTANPLGEPTVVTTPSSVAAAAPVTTAPVSSAAPTSVPASAPNSGSGSAPPVPTPVATVAQQLIAALNAQAGGRYRIPSSADNIGLLARWMANEGGLWADNPLNTSYAAAGYPHQFTATGVDSGSPIYPSMTLGVRYTASTLLQNPAYRKILGVLATGTASCPAFATAVIRSPWAASHYGYDSGVFCNAAPSGAMRPGHRGHRGTGTRHPTHPKTRKRPG